MGSEFMFFSNMDGFASLDHDTLFAGFVPVGPERKKELPSRSLPQLVRNVDLRTPQYQLVTSHLVPFKAARLQRRPNHVLHYFGKHKYHKI